MSLFDTFKKADNFELKPDDEFLTGVEVCKILHISDETLRRWEKAGRVKAYFLTPSRSQTNQPERPEDFRGKRYRLTEIQGLIKTQGEN